MYPVNLKMSGVSCLVIGGGHIGLRKIGKLLAEEAEVTVLAPEVSEEIRQLIGQGKVRWDRRNYQPGDCRGFRFVVTATGLRHISEAVKQEADREGFLYNAADFPDLGNCFLPASFRKGKVEVAVSTGGQSPAVARFLKGRLASAIPDDFSDWLDRVSRIRADLKEEIADSRTREKFWETVFNEDILSLVYTGKLDEAEEYIRHAVGSLRAQL